MLSKYAILTVVRGQLRKQSRACPLPAITALTSAGLRPASFVASGSNLVSYKQLNCFLRTSSAPFCLPDVSWSALLNICHSARLLSKTIFNVDLQAELSAYRQNGRVNRRPHKFSNGACSCLSTAAKKSLDFGDELPKHKKNKKGRKETMPVSNSGVSPQSALPMKPDCHTLSSSPLDAVSVKKQVKLSYGEKLTAIYELIYQIKAAIKEKNQNRLESLAQQYQQAGGHPFLWMYGARMALCNIRGRNRASDDTLQLQARRVCILLAEIRSVGLQPNQHVYSAAVAVLGKAGRVGEAARLIKTMKAEGLEPNVVTLNALAAGWSKRGSIEKAVAVLKQMKENNVEPDVTTYNTLVNACAKAGRPMMGRQLLDEMIGHGLQPNHITYTSLLDAYARQADIDGACATWQAMKQAGLAADEVTRCTLMMAFRHHPALPLDLWQELSQCSELSTDASTHLPHKKTGGFLEWSYPKPSIDGMVQSVKERWTHGSQQLPEQTSANGQTGSHETAVVSHSAGGPKRAKSGWIGQQAGAERKIAGARVGAEVTCSREERGPGAENSQAASFDTPGTAHQHGENRQLSTSLRDTVPPAGQPGNDRWHVGNFSGLQLLPANRANRSIARQQKVVRVRIHEEEANEGPPRGLYQMLDLHGFNVVESRLLLMERLDSLAKIAKGTPRELEGLVIVTGIGKGSQMKASVVRDAIVNQLSHLGMPYHQMASNMGRVFVGPQDIVEYRCRVEETAMTYHWLQTAIGRYVTLAGGVGVMCSVPHMLMWYAEGTVAEPEVAFDVIGALSSIWSQVGGR